MKPILQYFKMSAAIFLLTAAVSCSKKNNPAPAKTVDSTPIVVYDVKNTASIYPTTGMVVDASGNLYFADANANIITMYTPAGVRTVIAGSGHTGSADGLGTAASFNFPSALAIDA